MPIAPTHTIAHAGGDTIDRHQHDDHQLVYVSSGVVAINTEAGAWVAGNDRALWIPAHTWHQHRFYGAGNLHTVGFSAAHSPLPVNAPTVIAVEPLLRELLIALTADGLTEAHARRIRGVMTDRMRQAHHAPFVLPVAHDRRLAHACHLVEADLAHPRSMAWLATQTNTSERVLSRLFRDEFGMTYPQWRTQLRLFSAMVLLAENHTVTDTARATGWATTSAFIDTFARTLGATPGEYRGKRSSERRGGSPGPWAK
ncbi:AraC family transcriptional regulator [Rudaeicoccus suwonensis]|uniref:HTH-type transcriptional regulator RipA n=1 Tax=Rudaeicoccus suwonensis TaxID=657409 RepID=A0A561E123_9MICO|nr:helix-turn-helix transcriptional regulator [Rudaeicoccus suwonensis]TWE09292.1 AraC family transcriptional regulator [Rudaeicoccus suwonensis]